MKNVIKALQNEQITNYSLSDKGDHLELVIIWYGFDKSDFKQSYRGNWYFATKNEIAGWLYTILARNLPDYTLDIVKIIPNNVEYNERKNTISGNLYVEFKVVKNGLF